MDTEKIDEICEGLVGTVMTSFEGNFHIEFERDPTDEEVAYAEKYMHEAGIQECAECGWWQNDNIGLDGGLCWQCAENEEEDDEEEF